jgi:hypothetical protein
MSSSVLDAFSIEGLGIFPREPNKKPIRSIGCGSEPEVRFMASARAWSNNHGT